MIQVDVDSMKTKQRLAELGIQLPEAPAPAGNYVSAMQVGSLLYLSGAICLVDGQMTHTVGQKGSAQCFMILSCDY